MDLVSKKEEEPAMGGEWRGRKAHRQREQIWFWRPPHSSIWPEGYSEWGVMQRVGVLLLQTNLLSIGELIKAIRQGQTWSQLGSPQLPRHLSYLLRWPSLLPVDGTTERLWRSVGFASLPSETAVGGSTYFWTLNHGQPSIFRDICLLKKTNKNLFW